MITQHKAFLENPQIPVITNAVEGFFSNLKKNAQRTSRINSGK
jgi:hypothetical protein